MKTEAATEQGNMMQQAYPRGRWTLGASKAGAAPKQQVQGELSLEKVKPVRNDLSDTDLELIPAKRPELMPEAVAVPQENVFGGTAKPATRSWFAGIKARLFQKRS